MMLDVRDLHAYYGKSHILQGVSLRVGSGEIVSILGRNGVGRSTTLKAIMGDVPPCGAIVFKNEAIAGLKPFEIAHRGIGYVPEDRAIFPTLTVEQNLMLGVKAGKKATRKAAPGWSPSRLRLSAVTWGLPIQGGSNSGRYVMSNKTPSLLSRSTVRPSTSRLVGSTQCTSSKIISTGLDCDRASSCAASASSAFCRRCCGVNSSFG